MEETKMVSDAGAGKPPEAEGPEPETGAGPASAAESVVGSNTEAASESAGGSNTEAASESAGGSNTEAASESAGGSALQAAADSELDSTSESAAESALASTVGPSLESESPDSGARQGLSSMPLIEHLRELRRRLMISVAALIVGMVVSLPASRYAINGASIPIPIDSFQLVGRQFDLPASVHITGLVEMCTACAGIITIAPMEGLVTWMRVALILGLILATPIVLYQVVAYIVPALYARERRYLYLMLPGAAFMFSLGLAFGFFVVLPRSINFLIGFSEGMASPMPTLSNYIAFVTNLLFVIGIAFETPLVVYILSKVGILTPAIMSRYRRHSILVIAVLAAVLTPTPDPFTMFLVMAPMYLLYEMGGLMARIF
jgi:sec-independent protein translocase protein TatC